jgi:hypothetical protein
MDIRTLVSAVGRYSLVAETTGVKEPIAPELGGLVRDALRLLCSDPRDHLYGVLGIWQTHSQESTIPDDIRPNYRAATAEVFRDAIRYNICVEGSLEVLQHINHVSLSEIDSRNLPSWVLDWTPEQVTGERGRIREGFNAGVSDAEGVPEATWLSGDANYMLLRGFRIGRVKKATRTLIRDMESAYYDDDDSEPLQLWLEDVIALAQEVQDDVRPIEIGLVLGAGTVREWDDHMIPPPNPDNEPALQYLMRQRNRCLYHRFFTLDSGWMCCGPQLVEEGDVVVLIHGAWTPYVLRPDGSNFRFLGPCYVDMPGLMDGEVMGRHISSGGRNNKYCKCSLSGIESRAIY